MRRVPDRQRSSGDADKLDALAVALFRITAYRYQKSTLNAQSPKLNAQCPMRRRVASRPVLSWLARAAGFGMSSSTRPVDSLRPRDLMTHRVREFVSNDEPDETNVPG